MRGFKNSNIYKMVLVFSLGLIFLAGCEDNSPPPAEFPNDIPDFDEMPQESQREHAQAPQPQQENEEPDPEVQQRREDIIEEYIEPLDGQDKYIADNLLEQARFQQDVGRQPGLTYKRMVDLCRELIKKYPNSPQAQEARQMLRDLSEYQHERYDITSEEMGL